MRPQLLYIIELTPVENISVDKLETEVNFSKEGGLSLLAVMEVTP